MKEDIKEKHESFGMIRISRFSSNESQFFGSDLLHSGGISITISQATKVRKLNSDWHHPDEDLIRIDLSSNQYVDAITSGMNTSGVPCTIKRIGRKSIEQINHATSKKDQFRNDMAETQKEYADRIDAILEKLEGNVGKRKADDIKKDLKILKSHMASNTDFVMTCFNESMEKTVSEAKHSIANYIDHKIHSAGLESVRKEIDVKMISESEEEKK